MNFIVEVIDRSITRDFSEEISWRIERKTSEKEKNPLVFARKVEGKLVQTFKHYAACQFYQGW